jgi:hypothetical protein
MGLSLPANPAWQMAHCREIAGVYAGVRKCTAIHDQPFRAYCQWILSGFHRFFAVFFGFCLHLGTNGAILGRLAGAEAMCLLVMVVKKLTSGAKAPSACGPEQHG